MNATPKTWLDHTTISKALARIELIVQEANEDKRMTDNILKIIEIQNSVTFQGEVCCVSTFTPELVSTV